MNADSDLTLSRAPRRRRSDASSLARGPASSDVLFVDDEEAICSAFERSVRGQPYRFESTTDPRIALDLVRARRFALVVTDLRMPGIDGLTLIERMRRIQPDVVFLIVTGMPDLDLRRSTETEASILATLPKPWDDNELGELIQRGVELHGQRARRQSTMPPGKLRVLLVEDDPADQLLSRTALEHDCDASVEVAGRVSEAEVVLGTRTFDVVVTDLSLPDARGTDSVRRLRRAAPRSALMVMSGLADHALACEVMRLGAQEFLVKGEYNGKQLNRALTLAQERESYVSGLTDLAHYDQLTGLANRRTLRSRFAFARGVSRERGSTLAFLSIDLDKFKSVNDTLGHDAGDALLQEVAARLEATVREQDTVARLGGDEFGVLLAETTEDEANCIAERLRKTLDEPIHLDQGTVNPTLSIGVAICEGGESTLDEMMNTADATMYVAKRAGGNQLAKAASSGQHTRRARVTFDAELRRAVKEGGFRLAYQPQYGIDDMNVVGFEALMRWRREDGTNVSPGVFIPRLEDLGLIAELGEWLLETACEELCRWREFTGAEDAGRMAVNLSGKQFEDGRLVAQVANAIERYDIAPSDLELEITESVLMRDTAQTTGVLDALGELGVRVAIDDFGTGYSSLAYLQRFAVTTLKLDRAFVERLDDGRSASIVKAVIDLGRRLDNDVIAEGVETESQLAALRAESCDFVQGYYFARPQESTVGIGRRHRKAS